MGELILFPNNDWSKLVYPSKNGYFPRVPKLRRKAGKENIRIVDGSNQCIAVSLFEKSCEKLLNYL